MSSFWMVRAGEGGYLVEDFERASCVAIGWRGAGDFSQIHTLDEMRARIVSTWPDAHPAALGNSAGMAYKFRSGMRTGDRVVTYNPKKREYLFGEIVGDYEYGTGLIPDYQHVRRVRWLGRVGRDVLSVSSRNTLGSTLSVFEPGTEVLREMEAALKQEVPAPQPIPVLEEEKNREEMQIIRRDVVDRAHEFIKDRLLALAWEDMEHLVAAVLRAMGYKARVTRLGPDRGRDVIASPDGLGFQQPRIIAEVKHRPRETMGADRIRSFLGGLRPGDNGLFVSTGGFTREAKYEADRAGIPITLVDLDDLAQLVVEHYERFDPEGRGLIPLIRVYWPVS
ncbi:MAG TPA: restriction endonuclease [Longimicrobiaceae bacterium]|nr:restriction endonuclease [Longimicrobiaceae bacterium]